MYFILFKEKHYQRRVVFYNILTIHLFNVANAVDLI
jgi:hypothetical protein